MLIQLTIWALPVVGGKFLPKFQFIENNGPSVTFVPYNFSAESICDTKEEALGLAKANGIREAIEKYGKEAKIILKEE